MTQKSNVASYDAQRGGDAKKAANQNPPLTNRGVEIPDKGKNAGLQAVLHWLSITVWGVEAEVLAAFLRHFGVDYENLEDAGHGAPGFGRLRHGLHGVRVLSEPAGLKEDETPYVHVSLPGDVIGAVDAAAVAFAFDYLDLAGVRWRPSRVDVALDTTLFKPVDAWEAVLADDIKTRAHRDGMKCIQNPDGVQTVSMGSRSSSKYLRVYWRENAYTRVELECKGGVADQLLRDLVALGGDGAAWARCIAGAISGYVDFGRSWWAALLDGVAAIVYAVTVPVPTLDSVARWVEKQVAPSLALLVAAAGGDLDAVVGLLAGGRERWQPRHLAMLREASGGV